jgi:hypothetical protein
MVAGFAAAIDNGIGIAGIGPGARLWSVAGDPDAFPEGLLDVSGF